MKCGWDLVGCAQWRKLTITLTIQLNCRLIFKRISGVGVKRSWGLDGCARWRKVTITVTIQLNWIMIFNKHSTVGQSTWVGAWMVARGGARLQLQLH